MSVAAVWRLVRLSQVFPADCLFQLAGTCQIRRLGLTARLESQMRAVFRFAKISKALPGHLLSGSSCLLTGPGPRAECGIRDWFPDLLEESSALAIADEVVWTLNDSGTAVLFALSYKVRFWLKSPLAMRAMSIGSRWLRTNPIFCGGHRE